MSPRNQDDTNCKSDLFPGESEDSQSLDFTPNILHKKHRVIKLVKAQLLNIHENGLIDSINSTGNEYRSSKSVDFSVDVGNDEDAEDRIGRLTLRQGYVDGEMESQSNGTMSPTLWIVFLLLLLSAMFLMLLLAACLSAGPLSNRAPHTPIHWCSLVKTDGVSELERKYLLRWSTTNHLE